MTKKKVGMNFNYYDLGPLKANEIVEVTLSGSAANVRLMDGSNFNSYKNGRRHNYYGGLVKRSPFRIKVPRYGRWYVTVDMQGLRGSTRSSVRVLPSSLPEVREAPLSSVPTLIQQPQNDLPPGTVSDDKRYDVFVSHASEDKESVVRPLANALKGNGLDVWYDEFELKIGDSLRQKIDKGLSGSKFGIVVLSQSFLRKGWTNYELDGIVTRSMSGDQVLLPIWHNISKQEVIDYSPSLADKLARNTAMHTIEEIAQEISEVINGSD